MSPTARRALLLIPLAVPLFVVGLWRSPVDAPARGEIGGFTRWLASIGLGVIDYRVIEFSANVLWFMPFAAVAVVLVGSRRAAFAIAGAVAVSAVVETGQALFLPERVASVADVVANSVGAVAGGLVGAAIARRRERSASGGVRPDRPVEDVEDAA